MVGTIGTRLLEMLHDEELTDVTFVVQGTEIKAHRVVASSQGGVLKEKLKNNAQRVDIGADVAPHTFKTVLQYLYTDGCDINDSNLFELTHAATNLQLADLEHRCADVIQKKLTDSNLSRYTGQVLHFDTTEGVKVCQEYFKAHTRNILKTKEFLDISHEVLATFCSSDVICCSEAELFSACVEWAKAECQKKGLKCVPGELRAVLGDALKMIRFPCMTSNELSKIVIPSGILTCEELGQILYGWEKNQETICSPFPSTDRASVQVTIKECFGNDDIVDNFPLTANMTDLKSAINEHWDSDYPMDKFSLGFSGKELADETTLASIYTGKDLEIEIYSYLLTVKKQGYPDQKLRTDNGWEFSVIIKGEHAQNDENIIKGYVHALQDIEPSELNLLVVKEGSDIPICDQYAEPGDTVICKYYEIHNQATYKKKIFKKKFYPAYYKGYW